MTSPGGRSGGPECRYFAIAITLAGLGALGLGVAEQHQTAHGGTVATRTEGRNLLFPRAALQPKSQAGQEKGEERIGNTVEPFDEPGGNFRATRRDASLSVPGVV